MGEITGITWSHHTLNPIIGCVEVSEACDKCYAREQAKRMGIEWGVNAVRHETKLWEQHARSWNRKAEQAGERRRVFCASMSDVFEDHPAWTAVRPRLWKLIDECKSLTWLLLTKRPENINRMVPEQWRATAPVNVWFGTTTENDTHLRERWLWLRQVNAAKLFLSWEPSLGELDLTWILHDSECSNSHELDWVIAGCESNGHGLGRPTQAHWYKNVLSQCRSMGIAYFQKQLDVGGKLVKDVNLFPKELQIQEFPA